MILTLFKYCLPALLGYILFVGIAGRFIPFRRPLDLDERPPWFLGLWTGISVTIVLTLGLHMAYKMNLESVRLLFQPTAWLLGTVLLPGFIGYFFYRSSVLRQLGELAQQRLDPTVNTAPEIPDIHEFAQLELPDALAESLDESLDNHEYEHGELDENNSYTSIYLDTDFLEEGANDPFVGAFAMNQSNSVNTERTIHDWDDLAKFASEPTASPALSSVTLVGGWGELSKFASETPILPDPIDASAAPLADALEELTRLRQTLSTEQQSRQELETHLRITRKGLATLESESRSYESNKADELSKMETELDSRTKLVAIAESRASREQQQRIALETELVHMKQDFLAGKKEVRRSTESRARALSTANKAVAFARQSVVSRSRLEKKFKESEATLANRQKTISSLISSLEREKNRTQTDVNSMAKQLVLHEKQLRARRSLEEVARSVEGKLKSRLVKKVAKARPISSTH